MPGGYGTRDTPWGSSGTSSTPSRPERNTVVSRPDTGGGNREWAGEFVGTPTTVVDPRTFENVVERERDYGGTTYVPSERKEDKYGMGYYESTLLPSGLHNDPETWTYGEFGYGPGEQYGHKWGMEGPSWSQLTQWGIRTGQPWADPNWLVGGKPGEIGKKMDLGIGTTGGGPGGGGGGWGGYGRGAAGRGGYGYEDQPGYKPKQMAGFYTPQANLQQAMVNVHSTPTVFAKRGGIISLLRL